MINLPSCCASAISSAEGSKSSSKVYNIFGMNPSFSNPYVRLIAAQTFCEVSTHPSDPVPVGALNSIVNPSARTTVVLPSEYAIGTGQIADTTLINKLPTTAMSMAMLESGHVGRG